MKTIGLIGGLSWESSLEYYRLINQGVKQKLGGLHSAQCLLYSVDFGPIEELMRQGDWQQINQLLVQAALHLKQGGAEFILICSNTIHKCADSIIEQTGMPVLHIADAAAQAIKLRDLKKVGLLGTKFAMEEAFYRNRLKEQHGIDVIIPEENEREFINTVIFQELCLGVLNPDSKEQFKKIINKLMGLGAEGIVLGCTEIPLLIKQADVNAPVFDTMTLHAAAAVDYAFGV
ncbi:aspartate/glutamate racemase family protein [Sporomusa acidovorans]|uniref:L-aspartate/glutamate-specific racemase n=1 Tax=Sporomusa acidovorans (strain ATCC 49682 / DSM 3132 / Mol) TaxID=1123286 RepID=A0ABZ3IZ37_SPOA4|nr:aspartate/glutamate racemase family protein [Sporomusa acidovorans]OZC14177.1 aspartate racemase [Sporomusa acidovorans DSM 3132]SDE70494.1 aspartate racemase [Sporomusa acidovorans]